MAAPSLSPYRKAEICAFISAASMLGLFGWVIMLIGGSISFHLWPLLLLGPSLVVAGDLTESGFGAFGGVGQCPACKKSPFRLYGWTSGNWIATARLWWPEKTCSKCGHDLTEVAP
jgi:hypothetical protein